MNDTFFWLCMGVGTLVFFGSRNGDYDPVACGFMGFLVFFSIVVHYVERRIIDAEREDA